MNACAHDDGCHGRTVRRAALAVAFLTLVLGGQTKSGAQTTLPDGGVVISDDVVDGTLPVPDRAFEADGLQPADGIPVMGDMPPGPMVKGGSRWFVGVDALMLWQGNSTSFPLLVDLEGATALDVGKMRTQLSAGPRVSVIRSLGECHAIEGNFFQVSPFNSVATTPLSDVPYFTVDSVQLPFTDIDSATATGSGLIKSAELNWRHNDCCSPFTWLAGFRWVELNSRLNVDYAYTTAVSEETLANGMGSLNVESGNNLYGGQAGVDVRLWNNGGNWRFNGIGKAGLFANAHAYQRSTSGFVTDGEEPVSLGTVSASVNQVAFFGEVGLNATYCITHWLAWRAGYTVFWANGVAVAAQQLPLNDFGSETAKINTTGSVMLHGVTTGFEARW